MTGDAPQRVLPGRGGGKDPLARGALPPLPGGAPACYQRGMTEDVERRWADAVAAGRVVQESWWELPEAGTRYDLDVMGVVYAPEGDGPARAYLRLPTVAPDVPRWDYSAQGPLRSAVLDLLDRFRAGDPDVFVSRDPTTGQALAVVRFWTLPPELPDLRL